MARDKFVENGRLETPSFSRDAELSGTYPVPQ